MSNPFRPQMDDHFNQIFKTIDPSEFDMMFKEQGKDLNYELQIDCLPSVNLQPLDKLQSTQYKIRIEKNIIDNKTNKKFLSEIGHTSTSLNKKNII